MAEQSAQQFSEAVCLLCAIVHPGEHCVLEAYPTVGLLNIGPAGGKQFCHRVAAIERHQLAAQFVGGRVEGDREAHLEAFAGEAQDGRHHAGGGEGDMPGAEVES